MRNLITKICSVKSAVLDFDYDNNNNNNNSEEQELSTVIDPESGLLLLSTEVRGKIIGLDSLSNRKGFVPLDRLTLEDEDQWDDSNLLPVD